MFKKIFYKEKVEISGRRGVRVYGLSGFSLPDTLECGQCFRHYELKREGGYCEYIIPIGSLIANVAQREKGEIIFFDVEDGEDTERLTDYFSLDTDYDMIRRDVLSHRGDEWMRRAAECGGGIAILRQDPWETLFSFIVSQNNNIPRIKKIIRELSAAYGVNICLQKGVKTCPAGLIDCAPCEEKCKSCGLCYTFPTAEDVAREPEKMAPSKPGFRYKYLLDAAEKVTRGEVDLEKIKAAHSYEYTVSELSKICGVGLKVASCAALFGFSNLEAFPVDVWMRRAIDEHFDGRLTAEDLGEYAGVAQQYIFHYIRNGENESQDRQK